MGYFHFLSHPQSLLSTSQLSTTMALSEQKNGKHYSNISCMQQFKHTRDIEKEKENREREAEKGLALST